MTDDIAGLIELLRSIRCAGIDELLDEAADALSRLSQQVAELDIERDQAVAEAHCYRERHANDAYEMNRLSSERDKANERIAELESQLAARESAEPVAEVIKWQTFTGHTAWDFKVFDKTLEHGAKLYAAHPPAAEASEDAARLDYLDTRNARKNERHGTTYGWRLTENHNRIALEDHNWPALSVRAAIDAAIAAEKGGSTS